MTDDEIGEPDRTPTRDAKVTAAGKAFYGLVQALDTLYQLDRRDRFLLPGVREPMRALMTALVSEYGDRMDAEIKRVLGDKPWLQ